MTDIRPISHWKYLYMASYLVLILIIVWLMVLPWWVGFITLTVSLVTFLMSVQRHVQPIHISEPNSDNRMTYWQLLYEGYDDNELWEATLLDIHSYGHCMQLVFDTVHPVMTREYVIIWQDQVDIESWRQLKVLSRWT